jgi:hypothetical protein
MISGYYFNKGMKVSPMYLQNFRFEKFDEIESKPLKTISNIKKVINFASCGIFFAVYGL